MSEHESAPTSTASKPKKCSMQTLERKLAEGRWWPFDRAQGEYLERIEQRLRKQALLQIPDAPF